MNAIRQIRKEVFGATQAEFAQIAGVKQSSVSRWESGVAPTLDEMNSIRSAAIDRGIAWNDRWFFEPENASAQAAVEDSEAAA